MTTSTRACARDGARVVVPGGRQSKSSSRTACFSATIARKTVSTPGSRCAASSGWGLAVMGLTIFAICDLTAAFSETFDVRVDIFRGEMGYFYVDQVDGMRPTIPIEGEVEYTFKQSHSSNWYVQIKVAMNRLSLWSSCRTFKNETIYKYTALSTYK